MKKRIAALITALIMLLGVMTGCGSTSESTETTEAPAETADVSTAADTAADSGEDKYAAAYAKYDPDTVVMTVNGEPVTWSEYYYWIYMVAQDMDSYYSGALWSEAISDEYTFQTYAQTFAESYIAQYWIVEQEAEALGVSLTAEDEEYIAELLAEDIETYGGGDEQAFYDYLASTYISQGLYDRMTSDAQLYVRVFESYFGNMGENLSDEDVLSYANDNDYAYAKHILFLTVDADAGEELSDEEKAEKLALAEQTLAELQSAGEGETLEAAFDEKMNALSEDTGLITYPDGYLFTTDMMVTEFEDATFALGDYEMSDVVESSYGYHIILRLPITDPDMTVMSTEYPLRYVVASALFSNIVDGWYDYVEVEYTEEFENIDFDELFSV